MNDWLVANINNPDFTVSDFKNIADMSIDNTQFLKKDQYLKSDFIKNNPAFKGNDGQFSQKKFDQYYDQRLQDFEDFKNDKTLKENLIEKGYKYKTISKYNDFVMVSFNY